MNLTWVKGHDKAIDLFRGRTTLAVRGAAMHQVPPDVVAAAAPRCPPALWEQLRVGGKIVFPMGQPQQQRLQVLEKKKSGQPLIRNHVLCRFVPLIGTGL